MLLTVVFNYAVTDPLSPANKLTSLTGEWSEAYQQADGSWWINCTDGLGRVRAFRTGDIESAATVL